MNHMFGAYCGIFCLSDSSNSYLFFLVKLGLPKAYFLVAELVEHISELFLLCIFPCAFASKWERTANKETKDKCTRVILFLKKQFYPLPCILNEFLVPSTITQCYLYHVGTKTSSQIPIQNASLTLAKKQEMLSLCLLAVFLCGIHGWRNAHCRVDVRLTCIPYRSELHSTSLPANDLWQIDKASLQRVLIKLCASIDQRCSK